MAGTEVKAYLKKIIKGGNLAKLTREKRENLSWKITGIIVFFVFVLFLLSESVFSFMMYAFLTWLVYDTIRDFASYVRGVVFHFLSDWVENTGVEPNEECI